MPFGLTNAPANFQRGLDILLSGVKRQSCLVYLDDVIIYSNSEREHIDDVDQVLGILRRAGLSLKFRKSHFFKKSVNYLGHTIRPRKFEICDEADGSSRKPPVS